MHKFMRNCLTASVLAIGLAACGDDVTVTQPPAPPVALEATHSKALEFLPLEWLREHAIPGRVRPPA